MNEANDEPFDWSKYHIDDGKLYEITPRTKKIDVYYRGDKALGVIKTKAENEKDGIPRQYIIFNSGKTLQVWEGSGKYAFKLHDTYGYPVEMTRMDLAERGWALDERDFYNCMEEQKEKSRKGSKIKKSVF
jgi:hypothetical protein